MAYLFLLWKYKIPVAALLGILTIAVYIGILTRRAKIAQKQSVSAQTNANAANVKLQASEILRDANTIAPEVENEKKIANSQSVNSNASNAAFTGSVNRDSGTFAGNESAVNSRYCKQFPNDSTCR